jgi:hypothetical protein
MKKYHALILGGLFLACAGIWIINQKQRKAPAQEKATQAVIKPKEIEVQPFVTEIGWGYVIYMKGKPYIRQNNIPVIEGNQGFTTREKALKAGQLVAYKIEHAILPPTVSKQELDSLQLLN